MKGPKIRASEVTEYELGVEALGRPPSFTPEADSSVRTRVHALRQKLDEICASYDRPDEVRKLYQQNPDLMSQIESSVIEEQVMGWLLERAKVSGRPVPFGQLMGV